MSQVTEPAVFTAITEWVNHSKKKRQSLFVDLFSLVNLKLLTKEFLVLNVNTQVRNCFKRMLLLGQSNPIKLECGKNLQFSTTIEFWNFFVFTKIDAQSEMSIN